MKSKYVMMTVAGLALAAAGVLLRGTLATVGETMQMVQYLGIGLGCGMFGHGLGELIAALAARSDPEAARLRQIAQTDERSIALGNMAKARGYDAMIFVFGALFVAFALMGMGRAVLLSMAAAYLFVQVYAVVIRLRLEKEL